MGLGEGAADLAGISFAEGDGPFGGTVGGVFPKVDAFPQPVVGLDGVCLDEVFIFSGEDAFGDDPGASVISEDDLWGGDVHGVHMGRTPMMRVSSLLKMAP